MLKQKLKLITSRSSRLTSSFLFGIGFSLLFSKFPNTPFPWYRKVKKSNGSIGHSFYLDQSRLHSGQDFFEQEFSVFHHKKFSHLLENNFQAVEGWREI